LAQADDADPGLALDLAIGLGTAQRQTANPDYRDTLLGAARRAADLDDTARLVAAALANNPDIVIAQTPAIDAEWVEMLELALSRLPADHPDRALVLGNLCHEIAFGTPLERREALAEEAVSIAQASGDDATIVWVLNKVSIALGVPQRLEQSLAWSADALDRAVRLGSPGLLFWAAFARWFDLGRAGVDVDEMDRCLEITRTMAGQLHQPTLEWTFRGLEVARALLAGETERAEQLATEAFNLGQEIGLRDVFGSFGAAILILSLQRGTVAALIPSLEASSAGYAGLRSGVAVAYAEAGRVDDARELIAEFADEGFELPIDEDWLIGMTGYALAVVGCRDPEHADALLERIAPFADQAVWDEGVPAGPVGTYLGGLAGLLGRYDEADSYFARAAEMSERLGARFFAARTDLWWGEMLTERAAPGDAERARDLLEKAESVAKARGYAGVEQRATRALQDLD
jgi:tetratricopeptide (TPR) repeat protein